LLVQGSGTAPRCLADHRLQVVAALVAGELRRAALARLPRGSFLAATPLSAAAGGERAGADLRGPATLGLGPRLIAGETAHPHATVWRTLK
jgi:hypothetical protein